MSFVYAWTAPTVTPPNGNVSAPINTSATSQTKSGGLTVGSITAPQHCIGVSCITSWPTGGVTPPTGSEFLNTSATAQTKAGGLSVNSATSTKDIVVNGVTFGRGSSYNSHPYYTQSSTVTGYQALSKNNYGTSNTANGYRSLYSNTDGYQNTAVGKEALFNNTTGYRNTANGEGALYSNTTGVYNTAVGELSLWNNTGSYNTANGAYALTRIKNGLFNTASGFYAHYGGWPAVEGTSYNTTNGAYSLYNNTGAGNTANGAFSLYDNTTGSYNTAIGYNARTASGGLVNATAIGFSANVSASNYVRIGNANVTQIGGQVAWSNLSDKRNKEDIADYSHGLDFITKLRPVTFKFKSDATKATHSGFIAQEVEATNIPFYGLNKPANKDDFYSLSYAEFVVPLVNSVKELKAENDKLKVDGNDLRIRLERLEAKIN